MSELEGSTESKYTYGLYTQDPDFNFGHANSYIPMGGLLNAIVFFTNKGIPTQSQFINTIRFIAIGAGIFILSVVAGMRYAIFMAKKHM